MPGQLSLFGGPRQRGRRAPAAPERAVHIALADLLRVGLKEGWIWFHVPNGELRSKETGALLMRMGVMAGVSDFVLIGPPAGRVHALELKRRGMKPTASQTAFLAAVRAAGGIAAWADSFDRAVEILKDWDAVRVSLPGLPAERRLVPYAGKEEA